MASTSSTSSSRPLLRTISEAWSSLPEQQRRHVQQDMGGAGVPRGTSFDDVVVWWKGLEKTHHPTIVLSFGQRLITLCSVSRKTNPIVDLPDDISEEELDKLAKAGTDDEKRAVARHPSTSLRTLIDLAMDFAEDVDENPMLLLYLEQGEEDALDILQFIGEQTKNLDRLRELATNSSDRARQGVAWNRKCPAEILEKLSTDKKKIVRMMVASNPGTPQNILRRLSKDSDNRVRRSVSTNNNTAIEILESLANEDDTHIRSGVAANKSAPDRILVQLAGDSDVSVRFAVAGNDSASSELLEQLFDNDPHQDVQTAAGETLSRRGSIDGSAKRATNPVVTLDEDLTEEDLDKLSDRASDDMKRAIAKHPSASLELLTNLAWAGFAEDVDKNPTLHAMLPLYMEQGERLVVAIFEAIADQTTDPDRLVELAESPWDNTRVMVAINAKTPQKTLKKLASDPSEQVRNQVAQNENLSPALFTMLAKDPHYTVRYWLAYNKKVPKSVLILLSKDKDKMVRDEAKGKLSSK